MEADVLPSADKRYVHKEDKKAFPESSSACCYFWSLITGPAAVETAAVVSAAAWWAADRKYMVVAAAACRVAFFLPVVPELFYGFAPLGSRPSEFLISARRLCLQGACGLLFWHCEHGCSAAAALECDFCQWIRSLCLGPMGGTNERGLVLPLCR